jgi:hypothetical protein
VGGLWTLLLVIATQKRRDVEEGDVEDRINSRTNLEYTGRRAAAPPLTPSTALTMV